MDGADDYIEVAGYNGVTGTGSRTVCAWIKTDMTADGAIVSWGSLDIGKKWLFKIDSTNNYALRVSVGGGYIVGSTTLNDDGWHHVAAVLWEDGSPDADEIRLYVDGAEETISSFGSRAINTSNSGDVEIGTIGGSQLFDGLIDDVQIFSRALSASEISRLGSIGYGGAVQGNGTEATLSKCIITGNSAEYGGGIAGYDGIISNCLIFENTAQSSGGAIYSETTYLIIRSCTFYNNRSVDGGALYNADDGKAEIENCILWGNIASGNGANVCLQGPNSYVAVQFSDFENHEATIYKGNATAWFQYMVTNISIDPDFADAANGDFHLKSKVGRYDPDDPSADAQGWVTDSVYC